MLTTIPAESSILLENLAIAAARSVFLAATAGLALKLLRVTSISARLFSWTTVLYGALAIPLLGWLLPPLPLPVPFVSARPVVSHSVSDKPVGIERPAFTQADHSFAHNAAIGSFLIAPSGDPSHPAIPQYQHARSERGNSVWSSVRWNTLGAAIYIAVALLFLVRFFIGLTLARRLERASLKIHDPRVTLRASSHPNAGGQRVVRVHESDRISVPVTIGTFHPMILLPSDWRNWDDDKFDAIIAHEMSHVTRGDALTQRLSLLYRAVFWFNPLAWWLAGHLASLAEQASDEAALSGGADRNHYARTLLGFFEALQTAPGRVWWHGVWMAQPGKAEHRLERILAWRGAVTMGLKKSAAIVIVAFAIPVVYLAASARPIHIAPSSANLALSQKMAPPAPASAPAFPPDPAGAPVGGIPVMGPVAGVPAPVATRALSGIPAVPAAPAVPEQTHGSGRAHNRGYWYSYGSDDEQRFVIVTGKTDALTMSGTQEDARHVEKLRKQITGDFIWFQRDEKSYIIRDQATIDRARKLWAPQDELGKKQEELGKQQEALGKQQEELGAKMEQIRVDVPDMTAELDKLRAKLKALSSGATAEQVGELQSEIGELQSKLGEVQSHAGDQQGKLGEEMGALGEKQGKLGEQQGELGRQQGELAEKATREMKDIFDEAIKNGTAKPEPESSDGGTL